MNIKQLSGLILASAGAFLAGCAPSPQGRSTEGLARIEHIVVIYAENRSFDHLYGLFPGADGIASATPEQKTQLDHDGKPLPHLPPVYEGGKPSPKFPQGLPNGPFRIDAPPVNRRTDEVLPSPIHPYYNNRQQINAGKNNTFAAMPPRRYGESSGAAAQGEDGRRYALREGCQLGVVRRRLERSARRRPTGSESEAQRHLQPRRRQPELPAAPPAIQLLCALRAGHRRPRAPPEGRHDVSCRHRKGRAATGSLLQADRAS